MHLHPKSPPPLHLEINEFALDICLQNKTKPSKTELDLNFLRAHNPKLFYCVTCILDYVRAVLDTLYEESGCSGSLTALVILIHRPTAQWHFILSSLVNQHNEIISMLTLMTPSCCMWRQKQKWSRMTMQFYDSLDSQQQLGPFNKPQTTPQTIVLIRRALITESLNQP